MKKRMPKKLELKLETLHRLAIVGGNPTDRCHLTDTCADTCGSSLPVPSVDYCTTNALNCASAPPAGCVSTAPTCL